MTYITVLLNVYSILHCKNCVYLCCYNFFRIWLSLWHADPPCVCFSTYQTTWCYNPDNHNRNLHFYKNLKSHVPHCADNTSQGISWCSTNVIAVLQFCRLLQLKRTEAILAFWYLHRANACWNNDEWWWQKWRSNDWYWWQGLQMGWHIKL